MARIPLLDASEFADELPELAESTNLNRLNIIRAMGNNPGAYAAASGFKDRLYALLPATVREVTVLAVAREKGSTYVWHQHVRVARREDLPDETIRAIGTDDHDALGPADRALVAFVRAQCTGEVTDALYEAFADHFSAADVVAISRLAANYAGTADFLAALDVPLEAPFVGWDPGA